MIVISYYQAKNMKEKTDNEKIDKTDMDIIRILKDDSKKPLEEMSKALGLSKSTIYYRINRLIKRGIIKKFSIVLDNKKLGYDISALCCINIKFKQASIEDIANKLAAINGIESVYSTLGEMDFFVTIVAKSKDELKDTIEKINNLEEIERTSTFFILNKLKEEQINI
ncbi:MAG: Lrp/AsnC family transcriptional regulator [Thermoplasmata archaeon]